MTKKTGLKGSFKSHVAVLEREIAKKKKKLDKLTSLHEQTRRDLRKAYAMLEASVDQVFEIKVHGTKKADALKKKMKDLRDKNRKLTEIRDGYLDQIEAVKTELTSFAMQLAMLREEEINETKKIDDIVTQVFGLNETVVQASTARAECLKRHVFPRLFDEKGNMRSQITFDSADGLQRVVAMVNTMTIIKGELASEAQTLIGQFFARFQKSIEIDTAVEPLYELTRQLLLEKTNFKVGPDLYRFLSMELDIEHFPELVRAQLLLKQSIRFEKTGSYIRLWERTSPNNPWVPVPQS